jgi:ubiquinone/menaquinone biosynthesis C-methylase UbiE
MKRREWTSPGEVKRIRSVYERRARRGADERYSPFEPAHLYHAQALDRALVRALQREGVRSLAGMRILDVGCGGGSWLAGLTRFGADVDGLVGVDLREEALNASQIQPLTASADLLPFQSASFDMVCQLTMLSSVLDTTMRRRIAVEMLRVLKPQGILVWYDFTVNPLNRDVKGVRPKQLRALFPEARLRVERVTLAPPITRLLAGHAWPVCQLLELAPPLRTHILATVRQASSGES